MLGLSVAGKRISVIGTGNMGGAFSEALSRISGIRLCLYDSYAPCAQKIAEGKDNVTVLPSMDAAAGSDIIIIAVKPQILPSIYADLSKLNPGFFISIAAGVTLEKLRKNLGTGKVVRFMPNIAAKVGCAVTAVAYSPALDEKQKEDAMAVAKSVGSAFELDESLFAAFIGISGSGIAYMFELMHQMGVVLFLDGDLDDSLRQIQRTDRRPDLGTRIEAERLYARRRPLYEAASDFSVSITNRTFEEVAQAAGELLWEKGLL